jgi:diguanylate cyclase (GGDEF)-like protein/PAS domain S-box-containing protein
MRILSRLRLLSAISLASLIALAGLLSWSLLDFRAATANDQLVDAIRNNVIHASALRDEYFLYRDERSKRQWSAKSAEVATLIARGIARFPDPADRTMLTDLQGTLNDSAAIFLRIVGNASALPRASDARAIAEELDKRLLSQLLVKTATIHDMSFDLHEAFEQRVDQSFRQMLIIIGVGALVLVLTLISTLFFVARLIRTRLAGLHAGAREVASGRLDFRLACEGGDELAEVAQSINAMTDKLRSITSQREVELAERKLAERALAEFNRDFENFLLQTSDFIYFKDSDSRIRFCSQTLANITGHASWRDMIGKHDRQVFPAEIARIYQEEEVSIFKDGKPLLNKIDPYFDAQGRPGFVQSNKWPLFDEHGKVVGIFGISRDITEQRRTEASLQLAASVFTHAREGILITDADGVIVDVNATFTRITGYRRDEVIGRNPRLLKSGRQTPECYAAMWQALLGQGYWCGEVWNRRQSGEVYAELLTISAVRDGAGVTQNYVALFTDITQIKEHQSQLEQIAHYDALTGLPNRVLLGDRLRQAIAHSQRRGQALAVVYLDLDGFKAVNDNHGHEVGDELLIVLGQRMKGALRDGDTLARIGGDEFVAVLVDLERAEDCEPVLARLLQAAADPVVAGAALLHVTASIGVTLYPQDGVDADQLLRHADQAMYQAKQGGKNRYRLFDVAQDAAVQIQRESLDDIRAALDRQQFMLHYQPKVNMRTGQVIGVEALIRWQHPRRGLLEPAAFLSVTEEHPLGIELGEWVIDAALTQIGAWRGAGLDMPVSVNISARQLQCEQFVARLAAILAAHPDVAPASLELEIRETRALADMAQVAEVLDACRALGVRFALDDFGTGYSSLTYLKRLPVELLKIDQSFVQFMLDDPENRAIIEGVVGLAAAFQRKVIAEGVETVAQGQLLLPLGCELAQGYGIARPMPAAELPAWVASWRPDPAWSGVPAADQAPVAGTPEAIALPLPG